MSGLGGHVLPGRAGVAARRRFLLAFWALAPFLAALSRRRHVFTMSDSSAKSAGTAPGTIDYFGRLSWGNLLDWLITLCLGSILVVFARSLGGVRPETHLALLPVFAALIVLHGLWLAVNDEKPRRLSHVPLLFLPLLLWIALSIEWLSPTPWRGWLEWIFALEVFIFVWVLANNVRTRAHLWVLLLMAIAPAAQAVFIGFSQFFQDPTTIADAMTRYPLRLAPEFEGHATGTFADPNSFAVYLLMLLPVFFVAGAVPRLPKVLRFLSFYICAMLAAAIIFTKLLWPIVPLTLLLCLLPWLCFEGRVRRIAFTFGALALMLGLTALAFTFFPWFREGITALQANFGSIARLPLWADAWQLFLASPLFGNGGGSFAATYAQTEGLFEGKLPDTPYNDYLFVLGQFGLIGAVLFVGPVLLLLARAFRIFRNEPFKVKLKERDGWIMPPRRFFTSVGLLGSLGFGICLFFTTTFNIVALTLYGALFLMILGKSTTSRRLPLPVRRLPRMVLVGLSILAAWGFYAFSQPRLEAEGLELMARQQLDHIVDRGVHVSGNPALLNRVLTLFYEAGRLDPDNGDVWIGYSAALCQLHYRTPGHFRGIGEAASVVAERGTRVGPDYWRTWAQLGVARALAGDAVEAERYLKRALEMAPNSSNANYYYAAFLRHFPDRLEEARETVDLALQLNPDNRAARELQQKLRIL